MIATMSWEVCRLVCIVLLLECILPVQASQDERPKVLQLVAMVSESSSGTRPTQDWERGLEILPGARVAVQEVNRNADILPGYQLELVELITEGCSGSLALVQLVEHLVSQAESEGERESQTVGIIGPLCNEAAELIATVAGHPKINLPQIAAAPSDLSDDRSKHRYLFQMLPLSQAYINTVFGLMSEFGWENMAVLCSEQNDPYGCRTAKELQIQAQSYHDLQIQFLGQLSTSRSFTSALGDVRRSGKKIILAFLPPSLAAELICVAYLEEMNWPEYGWILPVTGLTGTQEILETYNCDNRTIAIAIEGLLLLDFSYLYIGELLTVNLRTNLVSGQNYSTYYSSYIDELMETANRTRRDLRSNLYASVFYDSVWAFALALNQSNIQFQTEFPYQDNELARNITTALLNLSFNGSTGQVEFDGNHNRKYIPIQINHIRERAAVGVGQYDDVSDTVTINMSLFGDIPDDDLDIVYHYLALPLALIQHTITAVGIVFTTILLILYIFYRNEPEIKATSPPLTLFIFLGCYLLLIGTLLITVAARSEIHGSIWRIGICQVFSCFTKLGAHLVFATLLVRIARVYRVFTYFGRTGKLYSNGVLTVVILCLVLVMALILALWAAVDTYQYKDLVTFHPDARPPYYEIDQRCVSENFREWVITVVSYDALLMLAILILAVKTRKVRKANFKDTKAVNTLIVALIMIWTLLPMLAFTATDQDVQFVFAILAHQLTAFSCQLLLFLPKVLAPLSRMKCLDFVLDHSSASEVNRLV